AQLVARFRGTEEVRGSNPLSSTHLPARSHRSSGIFYARLISEIAGRGRRRHATVSCDELCQWFVCARSLLRYASRVLEIARQSRRGLRWLLPGGRADDACRDGA